MAKPRIIIVSNRLPVSIVKKEGGYALKRSMGGLATALASVFDRGDALWVGWPGSKRVPAKRQLAAMGFSERLLPIGLSAKLLHHYYDRVANGVLWPIMHGLSLSKSRKIVQADWTALREVTRRFAQAILEVCQPDDAIWVHDYHLILLPQMLRDAGLDNRIGFFLHTPFPEENVLLEWPEHRQLLQSLSQTDVLGFQTQRDAAHFRIGLAATGMRMREGAIAADFPIGVDYKAYRSAGKVAAVRRNLQRFRTRLGNKKVILSVSRLDYTKGIIEQLHAVEQLLETHEHPERIIYKLIVAPSREEVDEYKQLKAEIDETVAAINARYAKKGFKPIQYAYRGHGFEEVNAWFRMARVLLVVPRIDGMNLVIKEYIAAHEGSRGMIVMSETIGAAAQLTDAIQVDPLNIDAITAGLRQALAMPSAERKARWARLRKNVKEENVFWWSERFLEALQQAPTDS